MNEKLKKAVCAAFGLPADATDEMLMSAASDLLAKNEDEKKKAAPEEMPPMVATQSATPAPVAASASTTAPSEISMAVEPVRVALAAAVAQTKELGEKIEKLEAEKLLAKTEALSEKLLSQGRLLPANKDAVVKMAKSLGLEEAERFFMALPTVVDMSTRGIQAASEGNAREKFDAVVSELAKKHDIPRSAARELAIQSHKQLAMAAFNLKEN